MAELDPNTGWQGIAHAEIGGHRESYRALETTLPGTVFVVDPAIATNWYLKTSAASLTVKVVTDVSAFADGMASPGYLYGLKLWIERPVGCVVTFENVLWSQDVRDPDGQSSTSDSLVGAAATKGSSDVYTLVAIPGRGTWGFLAGRGFS